VKTILFNAFPGGANRALTFSYDDGVTQDRRLVKIFNQHGMKGSFHLNAGLLGRKPRHLDAEEIAALFQGHEISAHSFTHPFLDHVPTATVVQQMLEDRRKLEALAGYPVRGMSYPYGTTSDRVVDALGQLGIEYSRTTHATRSFDLPAEPLRWHPTCHHNHDVIALGEQFQARGDRYGNRQHLMYVWGHSYEFDNDDNWDVIDQFCAQMANHPRTWYATNIEILDYLAAQRSLRFSADCDLVYNPSAIAVSFTADGQLREVAPGQTLQL
jgi:peptidoglycan/xylan/chitin deacetylase (PgdA/CDA1 family)